MRTLRTLAVFSCLLSLGLPSAPGQATEAPAAGLPTLNNPLGPPQQPLPYSHKTHVGLGLKCQECHVNPDPGEQMTLPATEKCMACHTTIATDKPAIQKLTEFAASGEPVPWTRVYRIPNWVWFSHRAHLETGAACEACHGPVPQRDVLARETDLSMQGCISCHRQTGGSIDCVYCHDAL